ncbi:MAG TPA: universal stress protein [Candidatus Sulfotelmatobacter sp.]|nr:universal stress protein [Candidatus Sulfotelmatobacter sp.]
MRPAFSRLTVPVDGTASSGEGVRFALELAAGGGSVTFCHAVDPSESLLPLAEGAGAGFDPLVETLREEGQFYCDAACAMARKRGIGAEAYVVVGSRERVVEDVVRGTRSEAIVIGTHARTGLAHTLLGSFAEGLMRRSDVPVIACHVGDASGRGPVVVAIDGSLPARAALETAIAIARARNVALRLIMVVEPGLPPGIGSETLAVAKRHVYDDGVPCTTIVRSGDPGEQIVAESRSCDASLIVTGTNGRAAMPRFFLGSVAADLLQRAHVPVVVVRAPLGVHAGGATGEVTRTR